MLIITFTLTLHSITSLWRSVSVFTVAAVSNTVYQNLAVTQCPSAEHVAAAQPLEHVHVESASV